MTVYLILFLIVLAGSAVVIFSGLFDRFGGTTLPSRLIRKASPYLSRLSEWIERIGLKEFIACQKVRVVNRVRDRISKNTEYDEDSLSSDPIDMNLLNYRVQTSELKENDENYEVFNVDICGTIRAEKNGCQTFITLSLQDVTDESSTPVQTLTDGSNMAAFCRRVELGRLPQEVTVLSDWRTVAQIRIDSLVFARKGKRSVQLEASIFSVGSNKELSRTRCVFDYDNQAPGYQDMQENAERTKVLAVALAFAVSAADSELCESEIELIENWARDNILESSDRATEKDARKLEKVFSRTVAFFREGNKLDTCRICKEIIEIAPVAQRYDILDLCLYVARADGFVAAEESALLKDLANWLEVDAEKFRLMMEKVLPLHMYEVKDVEAILGLTSDMSNDKARRHLNREYSRWNARVTNADPDIQSQADQMLKLITEARGQFTADQSVGPKVEKVTTK
ncbi:MAG: tellurite resistance TerB family protein [Sedimentisphaerales bacterium]|nr:tellurite resistance TerB family protein [Sedimentisphaerales bacterium]